MLLNRRRDLEWLLSSWLNDDSDFEYSTDTVAGPYSHTYAGTGSYRIYYSVLSVLVAPVEGTDCWRQNSVGLQWNGSDDDRSARKAPMPLAATTLARIMPPSVCTRR